MRVWRITRSAYSGDPLSGEGAARWGSRWNSRGVAMAFTSTTRPLAVLEMLVHVTREKFPSDAVLLPIDLPDDAIEELKELPEGWNNFPYGQEARWSGDRWIEEGKSLALRVPSAILPAERNILINPAHARFHQIRLGEPEPRAFDRRFFGLKT